MGAGSFYARDSAWATEWGKAVPQPPVPLVQHVGAIVAMPGAGSAEVLVQDAGKVLCMYVYPWHGRSHPQQCGARVRAQAHLPVCGRAVVGTPVHAWACKMEAWAGLWAGCGLPGMGGRG